MPVPSNAIWRFVDGKWVAFPGWFNEVFNQVGLPTGNPKGLLDPSGSSLTMEQLQQLIHPDLLSQVQWAPSSLEIFQAHTNLGGYGNKKGGLAGFLASLAGLGAAVTNVGPGIITNVAPGGIEAGGRLGVEAMSRYLAAMAALGIMGPLFDGDGNPLYDMNGNRIGQQPPPDGPPPDGEQPPDGGYQRGRRPDPTRPSYTPEQIEAINQQGWKIDPRTGDIVDPSGLPVPRELLIAAGIAIPTGLVIRAEGRGRMPREGEGGGTPPPPPPPPTETPDGGTPTFRVEGRGWFPRERPMPIFPPPPYQPPRTFTPPRDHRREPPAVPPFPPPPDIPPVDNNPPNTTPPTTPPPPVEPPLPPGTARPPGVPPGGGVPGIPPILGGGGGGAPLPGGFAPVVGGKGPMDTLIRAPFNPYFVPGLGAFLMGGK